MNSPQRTFNLFHAFILSFYSPRFYRDVARFWKGTGMPFLMILALIQALALLIPVIFIFTQKIAHELPTFIQQLPTVYIENGVLRTDFPAPYALMDDDHTSPLIIIDPTQTGIPDEIPDTVRIYASANRLLIRKNEFDTRLIDFSKFKDLNLTIDHPFLQKAAWIIFGIVEVIMIPIFLLTSILVNIFRLLFYSLLAKSLNGFWKLRLDYTTLLRLTAYALTPMILCKMILSSMLIHPPLELIFYFLIACASVLLALASQKMKSES